MNGYRKLLQTNVNLTRWGQVTAHEVADLITISSGNGLSPICHEAISMILMNSQIGVTYGNVCFTRNRIYSIPWHLK